MKESEFGKVFINSYLIEKFPYIWHKKIHGHEMQDRGIPDNLFCVNGLFLGIEFKVQRDGRITIEPGQIREINKIKDAKGIAFIIAFDETNKKILIRERRLDWKELFMSGKDTGKSGKSVKIDWDFECNDYFDAIDIISVAIKRGD
jgi:hypothetical protein